MGVVVERCGADGVIVLSGEFDLSSTEVFFDAVSRLAGGDPVACVVVQAGEVGFIDSSGLATLLTARRSLQALDIGFRLDPVSPGIRRVVEIADATELLPDN